MRQTLQTKSEPAGLIDSALTYADLLREAMRLISAGDQTRALELIDRANSGAETVQGYELLRALALLGLQRFDEAHSAIECELSRFPASEEARLMRLQISMLNKSNGKTGIDETKTIAETPVVGVTDEVARMMDEARRLISTQKAESALEILIKAKALIGSVRNLDCLRSECFLMLGRTGEALEALREELRQFPDNQAAKELLNQLLGDQTALSECRSDDAEFRQLYSIIKPYTMLSEERLYSLFDLAKRACHENIPGNFVECGVAGGGSTALFAWVVRKYSRVPRYVFAFDSYEGMPAPGEMDRDRKNGTPANDTGWGQGTCAAPEASVRAACEAVGAADILRTVKGCYESTLPANRDRVGMIALLHADADWYESTKVIFANLYDRLSEDAFIQIDDYGHWDGCRKAVDEFQASRGLKFDLQTIDYTGVWCRRPDRRPLNPVIDSKFLHEFTEDIERTKGVDCQMSLNELFQLYHTARFCIPMGTEQIRYVEIGSWEGASLRLLHAAMSRSGRPHQGIAVEVNLRPGLGGTLDALKGSVEHLQMLSRDAAPEIANRIAADKLAPQLIFVDGDHTYEGVLEDIRKYYPLLAAGGVMIFHDFLPPLDDLNRESILAHHAGNEPGIRRACLELLEDEFGAELVEVPVLRPTDPTQTQAHLPIIPGVVSTIRVYRKPVKKTIYDTLNLKKSANLGDVRTPSKPELVHSGERGLKSVLVSATDYGGAGNAAYRLHQGLCRIGVDSTMLVAIKRRSDPTVRRLPEPTGYPVAALVEPGISPGWNASEARWSHKLSQWKERPQGLEGFSDANSAFRLDQVEEVMQADVINLHWIAGVLDYPSALSALTGKRIIWTLHDLNAFTGGCHYSAGCRLYQSRCGSCPSLGSSQPDDLAGSVWDAKLEFYSKLDISVVTPSRWLTREAQSSSLFGIFPTETIPYGLDLDLYRPQPGESLRAKLRIDADENLILFGAHSVTNQRKGFELLLQALPFLDKFMPDGKRINLATFGDNSPALNLPQRFQLHRLGAVADESRVAGLYSMAEVFVLPSLEDNLPNTVLESLACGTPVVGFDIGGVPDMVDHGSTGYLARPFEPEDLANGIATVLGSGDRAAMRRRCREVAEERWPLERQANAYLQFMQVFQNGT